MNNQRVLAVLVYLVHSHQQEVEVSAHYQPHRSDEGEKKVNVAVEPAMISRVEISF